MRTCESCRSELKPFDGTHWQTQTGSRLLCARCMNEEIAAADGLDFEHPEFQPVVVKDLDGRTHRFEFVTRLVGRRVVIEAFEGDPEDLGGYRFGVYGDLPDADSLELFRSLYGSMRRALGRRHLEPNPRGHAPTIIDNVVRGRITSDPDGEDDVPVIVVDGQPLGWDELGRMLMTYEGFQIRFELIDRLSEVP